MESIKIVIYFLTLIVTTIIVGIIGGLFNFHAPELYVILFLTNIITLYLSSKIKL